MIIRSPWHRSDRADRRARELADRHYSRGKIGARQFVPPGRCLVLYTQGAYWSTSWPFAQFVKHAWPGAWICSAFRREENCPYKASDLIRLAVSHTREEYGDPPAHGMITFVDERKVKPRREMKSRDPRRLSPGFTYVLAGFKQLFVEGWSTTGSSPAVHCEPTRTKTDGLLVFRLAPEDMPPPLSTGDDLFAGVA